MTIKAGTPERIKVNRQPISGATNPPISDASATPTGAPVCINAPNLPLIFPGMVSETNVCPVAHSPPTPKPVIILNTIKLSILKAKPLNTVPMLYAKIVHCRTVFLPYLSESNPKITPPRAVAARLIPNV